VSTTTSSAAADRTPALDRRSFYCPHCAALAQQDWVALGYETQDDSGAPPYWVSLAAVTEPSSAPPADPFSEPRPTTTVHRWQGAQCHSCQEWSIWLDTRMVYPHRSAGGPAHPDMPEFVRELYQEAAAVAAVSRRAGAALARAVIERLIKELDSEAPEKARLNQRIDRLRGRVSTSLGQMLDVVRVVGNGALHVDEQPDELIVITMDDTTGPELIELMLETANDLVDELITRPRAVNGYWGKLPVGVQAELTRRGAALDAGTPTTTLSTMAPSTTETSTTETSGDQQ
jgi:Domain of unknown function (DUF4145)